MLSSAIVAAGIVQKKLKIDDKGIVFNFYQTHWKLIQRWFEKSIGGKTEFQNFQVVKTRDKKKKSKPARWFI